MKWFLLDHIRALSYKYDVTVMANTSNFDFIDPMDIKVNTISNYIERKISIVKDIKALLHLLQVFSQYKFDVVHSVTPKAGLLAMMAAMLTQVPIRIHTFTGQIWVTRSGLSRYIFKNLDKIIAFCSTNILVDSLSQQNFLIDENVVKPNQSMVLGKGSISGVDTLRFAHNKTARSEIRDELKIAESTTVFLFLGRLTRDKGILDLAQAFVKLCQIREEVQLLIVGPDEEEIVPAIKQQYESFYDRITFVDYTNVPEHYMAASDILCLPSYREGFGSVIIEAAAVGLPAIGSKIYGITDAIEENITGLLHKPADVESIFEAMLQLTDDISLRQEMAANAYRRAIEEFPKERITKALVDYYEFLVSNL
ncbi:MAG: glycosyltransferase family 4 protein [Microcoleus vaginatus WJT46-NPBG5]|nr:glycosyltransferase family 4 protein [Microcoleus vaginatus WJT46-NPBG5]